MKRIERGKIIQTEKIDLTAGLTSGGAKELQGFRVSTNPKSCLGAVQNHSASSLLPN